MQKQHRVAFPEIQKHQHNHPLCRHGCNRRADRLQPRKRPQTQNQHRVQHHIYPHANTVCHKGRPAVPRRRVQPGQGLVHKRKDNQPAGNPQIAHGVGDNRRIGKPQKANQFPGKQIYHKRKQNRQKKGKLQSTAGIKTGGLLISFSNGVCCFNLSAHPGNRDQPGRQPHIHPGCPHRCHRIAPHLPYPGHIGEIIRRLHQRSCHNRQSKRSQRRKNFPMEQVNILIHFFILVFSFQNSFIPMERHHSNSFLSVRFFCTHNINAQFFQLLCIHRCRSLAH